MAHHPANRRGSALRAFFSDGKREPTSFGHRRSIWRLALAVAALVLLCLAPRAVGQNAPKVNSVDPATGKVNDSVTLVGENLGKDSVTAVFLSDDKEDYKATLVEQGSAKIILKVPQVKSGGYNISIQEGDKIFILPLRFTVQG